MTRTLILTAITAMLVPFAVLRADDVPPEPAPVPVPETTDEPLVDLADDYDTFVAGDPDNPNLAFYDVPWEPRLAARFGVWGVSSSGSPYGVGEWQGLSDATAFWDIQGLTSNGLRTLDFYANGPEDEATAAGLYFYGGPALSLDIDYDRFIHRLGHPPLGGVPDALGFPPPTGFFDPVLADGGGGTTEQPGYVNFGEDFNPGRDYAIRVQTLDAKFQGNLTENIKWRLNVWGMKKTGNRRANSQQHCFQATHSSGDRVRTCHVVSQSQHIDWVTMEVEPVIEARFGCLTVEYSRTMRSFQQNDQTVINDFTAAFLPYGFQTTGAYAYVPENYTEIDRVKLRADLGRDTDLYVVGHVGNTHNQFRESDRKFYGVDARVTNSSIDGLKLTAYGKTFSQNNSEDTASLNDRYPAQAGLWLEQNPATTAAVPPQTIYAPDPWYLGLADRDIWEAGIKGRWTPYYGGVHSVTAGYEFGETRRTNVTYELAELQQIIGGIETPVAAPQNYFTQPTTVRNEAFIGLEQDWSPEVNTYVRYRFIHNSWPLVGVTHRAQTGFDEAINSNLPEQVDRVEIGGTWSPTDNFMMTASFWVENSYNHSEYVNFDEDSYPFVCSAWYAPNATWSFTAGYASFSNWIDQDVTLGRENGTFNTTRRGTEQEWLAWTDKWSYSGRADVVNLGVAYVASDCITLTGGFEYVRGSNLISNIPTNSYTVPVGFSGGVPAVPPPTITDTVTYPDIPGYSRVSLNTYRLTAGVDCDLTSNCGTFLRYNYYDYDDLAMSWNAGAAHMFLVGLNGVY